MNDVDVLIPTCRRAALPVTLTSLIAQTDDDVILEPDVIERMLTAIGEEGCGFVGSAVIGLSYLGDVVRPHEQAIEFWPELPSAHCGEDVLAQLRVMARDGGWGIIPSGVYHQELSTTLVDRRANAPRLLPIET